MPPDAPPPPPPPPDVVPDDDGDVFVDAGDDTEPPLPDGGPPLPRPSQPAPPAGGTFAGCSDVDSIGDVAPVDQDASDIPEQTPHASGKFPDDVAGTLREGPRAYPTFPRFDPALAFLVASRCARG